MGFSLKSVKRSRMVAFNINIIRHIFLSKATQNQLQNLFPWLLLTCSTGLLWGISFKFGLRGVEQNVIQVNTNQLITTVYALTCLQKYTRVTLNFTKYYDYNIVAYAYCVHLIIMRFSGYIAILIVLIKLIWCA